MSRRLFAVAVVSFLVAGTVLALLAGVVSLPGAAADSGLSARGSGTPTVDPAESGGAGARSRVSPSRRISTRDSFPFFGWMRS